MSKPGIFLLVAAVSTSLSCGSSSPVEPSDPARTGYSGEWSGPTIQGRVVSFTVSPNQKVTSITVGYNFNGCSGSRTFSNLSLDIATVQRPPGSPSAGPFENAGFGYGSGPIDQPDFLGISGSFTSTDTAVGVLTFSNFSSCGNGVAIWNATRR
jgi:hypothetical protein